MSEASHSRIFAALDMVRSALREAETRAALQLCSSLMLKMLPDGSGSIDVENPVEGIDERLFIFSGISELIRWAEATDCERQRIEGRECFTRPEREAADFAKLDLLFTKAGRTQ